MTRLEQERLMRYLDGESSADEAVMVERWLDTSAEARALREGLTMSGELTREIVREPTLRAESIVDDIMRALPPAAEGPSRAEATRRWFAWGPAAGLVLAAAASLVIRVQHQRAQVGVATTPSAHHVVPAPLSSTEVAEDEGRASEADVGAAIESVDFGGSNGTIFVVSNGPEETPVVWLMDEPEPGDDRMAPL